MAKGVNLIRSNDRQNKPVAFSISLSPGRWQVYVYIVKANHRRPRPAPKLDRASVGQLIDGPFRMSSTATTAERQLKGREITAAGSPFGNSPLRDENGVGMAAWPLASPMMRFERRDRGLFVGASDGHLTVTERPIIP